MEVINIQCLKITFFKIKAHSEIIGNKLVDLAVKEAHNDNSKFLASSNDFFN